MPTSPTLTGYLAAWVIVFVWAFWLIVSRVAESSGLTIYDLAALRYGLAACVALPICLIWKPWRGMSLIRTAVIAFILGPVYILCVFAGFLFAPASHGGIFMNGVLPLFSIGFGLILYGLVPGRRQLIGAGVIAVSAVVLVWEAGQLGLADAWIGDLLFLIGAAFFSVYVVLSERWQIGPLQILWCGTVINAAIYLPIWALWLPSGLAEAPVGPLMLQAVYQGFVPNLMGLLLIAHASRRIGTGNTASILAAVPGMGAVLGALILGERIGGIGIAALVLLTVGLLIAVRRVPPQAA
ncbi:DMT family transporter [Sulfitobacter albidus]|uniref:DMT family transporter n=1 Tax=Sulfitobacter albidus TaxID=2829501 RepID=A0A975PMR7_9RHOB|nr:DMT family transporter [Sulfitobacter albidus]QUJ77088.1 DMT family transporter [Sulfitobacter albidus]